MGLNHARNVFRRHRRGRGLVQHETFSHVLNSDVLEKSSKQKLI